jgi:hypothetical protein
LGLVGEDEAVEEDALDEVLVLGGELRDRFGLQPEVVVGSALVPVEDDVVASSAQRGRGSQPKGCSVLRRARSRRAA